MDTRQGVRCHFLYFIVRADKNATTFYNSIIFCFFWARCEFSVIPFAFFEPFIYPNNISYYNYYKCLEFSPFPKV